MMQRQFNSGVNQLPQSTIRANPYPISGTLKAGQTQADRYGIFEIDDFDLSTGTYTVKRPTADSLAAAQCLFSPANLEAGQLASFGMTGAFWVALDTSGGAPSVGDDVGTQTDSYKLLKDNTGFKCIAYNATEELCLVRPFSSGGAGVTIAYLASNISVDTTEVGSFGQTWHYRQSSFTTLTDAASNPTTLTVPTSGFVFSPDQLSNPSGWQGAAYSGSTGRLRGLEIKTQFADADENILWDITTLRVETTSSAMAHWMINNGTGVTSADKNLYYRTGADVEISKVRLQVGVWVHTGNASVISLRAYLTGGLTNAAKIAVSSGDLLSF